MDVLHLPNKTVVLIASSTMVASSVIMLVSGGAMLPIAAIMAGASFGVEASVKPLLCRLISPENQATLYALTQIPGLVSSTGVIWFAGFEVERLAAGAANCIGAK